MNTKIKLFENQKVRALWNVDEEEWYFSVVDVVKVLTDSLNPKDYIKKLKKRDKELNSRWGTICHLAYLQANDGKKYKSITMKTSNILRLIQSIPSKKAEPFKMWLAQVGSERLDEIVDPKKAFERGIENYRNKGYQEDWIQQRLKSIDFIRKLTEQFNLAGVKESKDYAILTNKMTKAWSGLTIKEYKNLKGLKKESLRDNMTDLELVLNSLAEITTTELCKTSNPSTLNEIKKASIDGGTVAGNARKEIKTRLGHSVITNNDIKNGKKIIKQKKK